MNLKALLGDKFTEELSVEDLLKLANDIEYVDPASVVTKDVYDKLKLANDKNSHDASEWKKKYNSTLTEQEQAKIASEQASAELQAKYDALLKETNVMKYTNQFLASGMDEKLAKSSAEALANGDMDTVFENQKKFASSVKKQVTDELLKDTPKPDGGNPDGDDTPKVTRKDISKMSLQEQLKFSKEHPEEYKQAYGNVGEN
jgi:hypothetical protein